MDDVAVIILAAGKGTRMKSDIAKVLHRVAGKCMVNHVVESALGVTQDHVHVVVGHQADQVMAEILTYHSVHFAFQEKLLGTGDAVKAALPGLDASIRNVLVLCGDVPLIQRKTIQDVVQVHADANAKLTVLAVQVDDPTGYGRIIQGVDGSLTAIREEADADPAEKHICVVNSGIYCFDRAFLESGIQLIRNTNNQAEYYLTDLVEIAVSKNVKTLITKASEPDQVMGVNTLEELGRAQVSFDGIQNELS